MNKIAVGIYFGHYTLIITKQIDALKHGHLLSQSKFCHLSPRTLLECTQFNDTSSPMTKHPAVVFSLFSEPSSILVGY